MPEKNNFNWKEHITPESLILMEDFLLAMIIFVLGFLCAKLCKYILFKRLMCFDEDKETLYLFLSKFIYWIILLCVVIASLSKIGVQTAPLIAIAGGASLAIGLSLKSSLSNVACGILLVFIKPFKKGDYIKVSSFSGQVMEIDIMFTILLSSENERILIPNSKVFNSEVVII
jgi:small conductance mechanosensitive channel